MVRSAVRCIAAVILLCAAVSQSRAVDARVGSWTVRSQQDDFSDHPVIAAVTQSEDMNALFGIRCRDETLNMIVVDSTDEIEKGQAVPIKVRFDHGEIIDGIGEAVSDGGMVITSIDEAFIRRLLSAQHVAVRLVLDTSFGDFRFELDGTRAALKGIMRDCHVQDAEKSRTER